MNQIFLTRLVIETTTPMAIYSGNRETGFDNQLARDANGLPYIPATSIAGVWRTIVLQEFGESIDNKWFGFTTGINEHSSQLSISNGIVHGADNQPTVGLKTSQSINADPLLALLKQDRPMHRERVSINDRGVAKDTAKFDQLLLPKGVRFTIDISFNNNLLTPADIEKWQHILHCWTSRSFALGATTRNGLGQFAVIGSFEEIVELHQNPQASLQLSAFAQRKQNPIQTHLSSTMTKQPFAVLPLKALDNWRCGSGTELLGKDKPENTVSLITYSESGINWVNNPAVLNNRAAPVLCGSSIKGILAHRITYHLRKHLNIWAEDMAEHNHEQWQTRPEEIKALLGWADDVSHKDSLAGRLYVDDSSVDYSQTVIRHHNSIDRFTGGVRKGALYSEELLYQPEFTIKLWLTPNTELSPELTNAIADALNDLKTGILPMGAGSGRGNSLVTQNPNKEWLVDMSQISVQKINVKEQVNEC
jgi:CRISPR/Cas system CMR subunit Cmr4 (Cas7 group RAMP superfamily)